MAYYVLEYTLVDGYAERRPAHRAEHLQLARAAHERGELLLAGALGEPLDRALLVWDTEDATPVEEFAAADPYVRHGLVTRWTVRPWTVVVGGRTDGAAP
ncbi:YciI-like protein [Streptomyces sp. NPDC003077]|uniref:YciI-like protein n=1 Tax=Streptomyces sp. NPDC003077 TaxID=3154443 RepID=UPI0033B9E64D